MRVGAATSAGHVRLRCWSMTSGSRSTVRARVADRRRRRRGPRARAANRSGVVGVQGQQRLRPRRRCRPAWRASRCPRRRCTGSSLRARPAPRRHAETPTRERVEAGEDAGRARRVTTCVLGRDGQRGVRVAALGRDHPAPGVHRAAVAQRRRPGRARATPASVEHLAREHDVSSTTSAGPPPASTSTDSRTSSALPAVRPERGVHGREQRAGAHAGVLAERDHALRPARGPGPRPS